MRSITTAIIALSAVSQALVARTSICCFHLSVNSSTHGGAVGQLSDGQNRVGDSSLPQGQYCNNENGLSDILGRGCLLTPPTSQFQCDAGAAPAVNFTIGCDGNVYQGGSAAFSICPTGQNGGYNIYKTLIPNQDGCEQVTLIADGCRAACPPPPPPALPACPSSPPPPPPPICPSIPVAPSPSPTPTPTPSPTPSPAAYPASLKHSRLGVPPYDHSHRLQPTQQSLRHKLLRPSQPNHQHD